MDRITILGLDPLGISIGLALKRAGLTDIEILGTDPDKNSIRKASEMHAIDVGESNLNSAIKNISLLIINRPLSEIEELLEAIGPNITKKCIVTDTGSVKTQTIQWAEKHLPSDISFVGGRPITNRYISTIEEADASIFEGTRYCIVPAESATPEAVRTVAGLAQVMGSEPLFLDSDEYDSFSAAVVHVPTILSSALVNSTSYSASWKDMSHLAQFEFHEMTTLADHDPRNNAASCLANPQAVVHWLDQLINELNQYRDDIQKNKNDLVERFIDAWEERAKWEAGTIDKETESAFDSPSFADSMGGMFLGRRIVDRSKRIFDLQKQPKWKYPRKKR